MGPVTTEYEFTFVVSGATVDDVHIVKALQEQFDAMLFRGAGVDLLTVAANGDNAVDAAMRIVGEITQAVQGLLVVRLDRGLVGISEIARRTERSRQNVTQWVNAERQAGQPPFPIPEGTAGRSLVWLWTEVNEWLRPLGLDDGFTYPSRSDMNFIDHLLNMTLIDIVADDFPADEFAPERAAIRDRGNEAFHPGLLQYLAVSQTTKDDEGRHVVVIAAPEEPARRVMQRMAAHGHDVVLMTKLDSRITAMVMSQGQPVQPTGVVPVPMDATLRQWLELMQRNPSAIFVLSSAGTAAGESTGTRQGAVLTAAA